MNKLNRFMKDIFVPPSTPKDLICEECERNISVLFCNRCNEVFCMNCADLTHPIPYGEIIHPHENENIMRVVKLGDKSNVTINKSFFLPDTELNQDDYQQIKDLSVPSSLCTTQNSFKPSKSAYSLPRYSVNQMILFIDPHSETESYGRIISQWDFRLANVAPAILRGDGAIVYYIIKLIGFTKDLAHLSILLRESSGIEQLESNVIINGIERSDSIDNNKRAQLIDKRISDLEGLRKLGPKYHLRDVASHQSMKNRILLENRAFGLYDDNDDSSYDENHSLNSLTSLVPSKLSIESLQEKSRLYPFNNTNRKIRLGTQNEFVAQKYKQSLEYDGIDLNLYADIDTDVQSQLSTDNIHRNPLPANLRTYESLLAQSDLFDYFRKHFNCCASSSSIQSDESNLLQMMFENISQQISSTDSASGSLLTSKTTIQQQEDDVDVGSKNQLMQSCLKILVLSETDICSVEERLRDQFNAKFSQMKSLMLRFQSSDIKFIKFKNFIKWKDTIIYFKTYELHIAATKIQAMIRMFLCKDKITEKIEYYNQLNKNKWLSVHRKYRYSDSLNLKAKTMNKAIYFETLNELNKYAAFLRVCIVRIIKYMNRKCMRLLNLSISKWKSGMTVFLESDIKSSHIHDECVDHNPKNNIISHTIASHYSNKNTHLGITTDSYLDYSVANNRLRLARERLNIAKEHLNVVQNPDIYIDELSYETITSKPLRVPTIVTTDSNRLDDEKLLQIENDVAQFNDIHMQIVPSYIPSENMTLPDLLPMYIPISAKDRLHLRNDRRLNYYLFKDKMQGPTFDSNWIILHILLMGSIPWSAYDECNTTFPTNKNTKFPIVTNDLVNEYQPNNDTEESRIIKQSKYKFQQTQKSVEKVSAISMLLLTGIDYFISLLEEDEEALIEKALGIDQIKLRIEISLKKASIDVGRIVSFCTEIIRKQQVQIDAIPPYGKTDPRYPRAYREKLRCKARIQVASDNMRKAKSQIKNLATQVDWLRIPLKRDGTGMSINQIMPYIWQVEDLMRQGRKIYIYSGDGHGRAGLISGILLGRLYNLHSYEALYRVQASHDSAMREIKRDYPINCPQLPNQRNLLTQVLNNTNLPQDTEITIRTQVDPETFLEQVNRKPLLYKTNTSDEQSQGTILTRKLSKTEEFDKKKSKSRSRVGNLQALSMEQAILQNNELVTQIAFDLEQGNNKQVFDSEDSFNKTLRSYDNMRMKQTIIATTKSTVLSLQSNCSNPLIDSTPALLSSKATTATAHRSGIIIRGAIVLDHQQQLEDNELEQCIPNKYELLNLPDLFDHSIAPSLKQSVDLIRKLPKKRQEPAIRPLLPLIRSATNPAY